MVMKFVCMNLDLLYAIGLNVVRATLYSIFFSFYSIITFWIDSPLSNPIFRKYIPEEISEMSN